MGRPRWEPPADFAALFAEYRSYRLHKLLGVSRSTILRHAGFLGLPRHPNGRPRIHARVVPPPTKPVRTRVSQPKHQPRQWRCVTCGWANDRTTDPKRLCGHPPVWEPSRGNRGVS